MMKFLLWLFSYTTCLIIVLSELNYDPLDNYLIDCGSSQNVTVSNRVFVADNFYPNILSTPFGVSLKTVNINHSDILFQTARVFNEITTYSFPIKAHGRHWIRLHFFPFVNQNYNLSSAKFSVSSQNFTLLKEFQPQNDHPVVKEYSLNVTTDVLILTFTPSSGSSFAFINALEVISLPNDLLPNGARAINLPTHYHTFSMNALETMARLNMGNSMVSIENDTLWRVWNPDGPYLMNEHFFEFKSNVSAVNYSRGWPSTTVAPPSVYGTVTMLSDNLDPRIQANMTWLLAVDPGFDYLVRLHFCDFVTSPPQRLFLKVYANSLAVEENLDLSRETSFVFGAPYYLDFVVKSDVDSLIRISIASSTIFTSSANAILSGLEIMKISNPGRSLSPVDVDLPFSSPVSGSKLKLSLILGIAGGVSLAVVAVIASMFFLFRKLRRRRVHGHLDDKEEDVVISSSNLWYRFALATIEEATENFSESNVIGFGGFGRVYKGILKDGTVVAVKRGDTRSQQGMSEFRTEIEMLSLFRHRHLVSLIGYCDEQNEMIIIYEYMQNGTLRNHLYDDNNDNKPSLPWRKRLEICIGSAKGLHYLHTGSGSTKAVIHRDVKSSNILLDENLMAKVSDFGISRNGPDFDETHVSTAVKGSFGYLDPEYLTSRQLTEKSDVYSFGVVMLEVLCGRAVIDPSRTRECVNLVEWVMEMEKRGELEKTVDDRVKGEEDIRAESVRKFGEIALKCLGECGNDRPTMGNVLWNLESALQLQVGNGKQRPSCVCVEEEEEDDNSEKGGTVFSTVSMGDLDGVSISRVFSQMVKAEVRRTDEL